MGRPRTPGFKLFLTGALGILLLIPLLMVYGLVSDRQSQARIAQDSITAGWGGQQIIGGPVLMIPYTATKIVTDTADGKVVRRSETLRHELFLSPQSQTIETNIAPEVKSRAIYASVIYDADVSGSAQFVLPDDLDRYGVTRDVLLLDEAEVRLGVSDPRGLQADAKLVVNGTALPLAPGKGTRATGDAGMHAFLDWNEGDALDIAFQYSLRGSHALSLTPRGGVTDWKVVSPWAHPSFSGAFLPDPSSTALDQDGFDAQWSVSNLALGQSLVTKSDFGPPVIDAVDGPNMVDRASRGGPETAKAATIRLIEPVDLYNRVDRSVKYGFLFIGFTFLAFLMFDIVGGARVAAAEYLMTGAGLVLFFVLLLALSEVIGFAWAYVVASAAIVGLLTAYSSAVLGSLKRAQMIGLLLLGLYAALYTLLSLEAFSLLIGSVLLFVALAATMYATRNIDWSSRALANDEADEEPFDVEEHA